MTRFRFASFGARSLFFSLLAVILTMSLATPAIAHHKEGHEQGKQGQAEADDDGTEAEQSSTTSSASSGSGANDSGSSSDGAPPKGCDQANHEGGGAYHSTCDGSPGENGNGGNGKVAGGEGSADNKFPPGQDPDGSDGNKGYECDENRGVAKGNPAHSKCKPPAAVVCVPTAANNFCQPPKPPKPPEEPEVLRKFVRKHPPTAPPVTPPQVAGRRSSQLPTTGFDSGHALWIALLIMVLGACLTMVIEDSGEMVRSPQ